MNELVLFGVTGDLAKQKLIPSLYRLYESGMINKKSSFIGFGRKKFTKVEFQNFIEEVLVAHFLKKMDSAIRSQIRNFSAQWSYVESELDDISGYTKLASLLTSKKATVYISLPPMYQYQVCNLLIKSGVIEKSNAKESLGGIERRIALEKPYGFDSVSSEKIDEFLIRRLRSSQIIRVDHYAGKQALVELEAVARQGIFENILHNRAISKIKVQITESIDVATRGNFYNAVGALSDIGQNHLLHMLAVILVAPVVPSISAVSTVPKTTMSELRGNVLSLLEISKNTKKYGPVLGQYVGFTKTAGVAPDSTTETFFRVFAHIKKDKTMLSKQWGGVEVELVGGKALKNAEASITLFSKNDKTLKGKNTSRETEYMKILINGYGERDAYDQIFLDIFTYNPNRFIDFKQIKLGWSFIEKVKKMWAKSGSRGGKRQPVLYEKGSYPQDILAK